MDDFAGPKPMPRPNLIGPTVPPGNVPPIELAHDEKRDECDPVALTDAERAAIRQTLVAEWRDDYSVLSLVNALAVTVAHIKAEAVEQERELLSVVAANLAADVALAEADRDQCRLAAKTGEPDLF